MQVAAAVSVQKRGQRPFPAIKQGTVMGRRARYEAKLSSVDPGRWEAARVTRRTLAVDIVTQR
jgi:hypothetical protein